MSVPRISVVTTIFAVIGLVGQTSAYPYVLYNTGTTPKPGCGLEQPRKLRWQQSVVKYDVSSDGIGDVGPLETVRDQIIESYDTWATLECFAQNYSLEYSRIVSGTSVGYDQANPSANSNDVLFVHEGWDHGPGVLGLTTLTYDTCSGVIVDADIELNTEEFTFSTADNPGPDDTDLRNTVTHEVGHVLGLDHSLNKRATMYAKAPTGESSKRHLDQDDIDGVCFIYDVAAPVVVDHKDGGSSSGTATTTGGKAGCGAATGLTFDPAGSVFLLLLFALGSVRARRRG